MWTSHFIQDIFLPAPLSLQIFTLIGLFVAVRYSVLLCHFIYNFTLRKGRSLAEYGAGTGAWAVVTGASEGIGQEFVYQLAAAKFNVVLLARTRSKLEVLAKEIQSKHQVETIVYPFDFANHDPGSFDKLARTLNPLKITVLVNNVGTSHAFPISFVEESQSVIENIVNVNITSVLQITRLIAPKMVAQKNGLILNLGSFAGLLPQPLLSVYSASKSFLLTWSQALGREVESHGVTVECLNTYFVVSAMSKIRKSSFFIPTPKQFVRAVLVRLGNAGGSKLPYCSSPYFSHGILNWVVENLGSHQFWNELAFKTQKDIRERALKKLNKSSNEMKKEE